MNIWTIPVIAGVPLNYFHQERTLAHEHDELKVVPYADYEKMSWDLRAETERQRRQFELDNEAKDARIKILEEKVEYLERRRNYWIKRYSAERN